MNHAPPVSVQDSSSSVRSVTAVASIGVGTAAPGFVQGTLGHGGPVPLDPFLSITEFWMSEPVFAPHPHAGFSAVTYMFSDSVGGFVNRDSLGDRSLIGPGSLHWTQAGSGMLHEEVPEVNGTECHGMQLFVNLRADDKALAPCSFHLDSSEVPVVTPTPGVVVRVVLGSFGGSTSPLIGLAEPVGLLEVTLEPDAEVLLPVAADDRMVVLVSAGPIVIGADTIGAQHVVALDGPAAETVIHAGTNGAHVLVLTGRPMREPVVFGGSFVALDRTGIDELNRRFRRGEMGTLTASFGPGVG